MWKVVESARQLLNRGVRSADYQHHSIKSVDQGCLSSARTFKHKQWVIIIITTMPLVLTTESPTLEEAGLVDSETYVFFLYLFCFSVFVFRYLIDLFVMILCLFICEGSPHLHVQRSSSRKLPARICLPRWPPIPPQQLHVQRSSSWCLPSRICLPRWPPIPSPPLLLLNILVVVFILYR